MAETTAEYTVDKTGRVSRMSRDELVELVGTLEQEMRQASKALEFERAAQLRDMIVEIREKIGSSKPAKGKKTRK